MKLLQHSSTERRNLPREPSGQSRYYDGMLCLMSLMHVSGEFRIVEPKK